MELYEGELMDTHRKNLSSFYAACNNLIHSENQGRKDVAYNFPNVLETAFYVQVKKEPEEFITDINENDVVDCRYKEGEYDKNYITIKTFPLAKIKSENEAKNSIHDSFSGSSCVPDNLRETDEAGRYECCYCNRIYRFKKYLNHHIRRCHIKIDKSVSSDGIVEANAYGENKSVRKISKLPSYWSTLEIWNNSNFRESGSFECFHCNRNFRGKKYLRKHICKCHEDSFNFTKALATDKQKGLIVDERKYLCLKCDRKFFHRASLRKHLDSNSCTIKCEVCGYIPRKPCELKRHMVKHTKERICCQYCSKQFSRVYLLRKHLKSHNVDKYVHLENGTVVEPLVNDVNVTEQSKFICKYCLIYFQVRANYEIHMKKHSSEGNNVKLFQCLACNKQFAKRISLHNHAASCNRASEQDVKLLKSDNMRYSCKHCCLRFRSVKAFRNHKAEHSLEEIKPYGCVHCGKRFVQRYSLINHFTKCS